MIYEYQNNVAHDRTQLNQTESYMKTEVAELVMLVSCLQVMFHEYGDEKLQIGSLMHHNESYHIYITIYISIHSHMFVYVSDCFGSLHLRNVWTYETAHTLTQVGGDVNFPPFIHGFMSSNP